MKRKDYISWDEYFMGVALLSAQRSKDPVRQIGACIVNSKNRIIGIGYNWLPAWCNDDDFPRGKNPNILEDKRTYVVHAEVNAILNSSGNNIQGSTLYVLLFPCHECTKLIIQSWIKRVVYISDEDAHKDTNKAAKKMLKSSWIELVPFEIKEPKLILDFERERYIW